MTVTLTLVRPEYTLTVPYTREAPKSDGRFLSIYAESLHLIPMSIIRGIHLTDEEERPASTV